MPSTFELNESSGLKSGNLNQTTGEYDDGECAVCLASPQVNKSFPPCGHTFCYECIDRWCNTTNDCPICKQKILLFKHSEGREVKYILLKEENRPFTITEEVTCFYVVQNLRSQYSLKEIERARLINQLATARQQGRNSSEQIGIRIAVLSSLIDRFNQALIEPFQNGSLRRMLNLSFDMNIDTAMEELGYFQFAT